MSMTRLAVAALVVAAGSATAQNIIDTIGTPTNGSNIVTTQYNAVNFSFSTSFSQVGIDASLITLNSGQQSATAYLTNQVGPGTTAANVIASTTFNFVNVGSVGTLGWVDLFDGLTLGAGSYWLVFGAPFPVGTGGSISLAPGATYVTDPGATVNGMFFSAGTNVNSTFVPASTFAPSGLGNRFIRVSGIPAPSAAALLGAAGLVATRRRR